MDKEGFDFYFTPISCWLSHCLFKIHNNGGSPIPLVIYEKEKETTTNNLIDRLEEINNNKEWAD